MNLAPPRPALSGNRHWSGLSILSKRSFHSFATSSFHADDERSSSDDEDEDDDMESRSSDDGRAPRALYAGYDGRPTSRKELMGWYMYAFAAETYVICGIGAFIPILLESLARENGVLLDNPDQPCGTSDSKNKDTDGQCVVYVLGIPINTASFAMYTFSVSVLVQALLVVSISCAADHGNYRKKLLLAFAWIGSSAVMAYIFITKETYILGALLTVISNTSFGASFVLLNSFLPLLVRNHPDVIEANKAITLDPATGDLESRPLDDTTGDEASSESPLLDDGEMLRPSESRLSGKASPKEILSKELELSTEMSSKGIGVGYSAALFLLCVSIAILLVLNNTTWAQRVVLFIVGLWWAVFTIPAAMWLRPRPGPPLTEGSKGRLAGFSYLVYAWKSLFRTALLARQLKDILLFLAGWFLLSDAIATTSGTAILFAKTTLHMKPWALGMINVITTCCGIFGALGWSWVSRLFRLQPHQTILVCIALFELIPIYGLIGYLPFVQSWGVFGLQQPWEMYPLAAVYGLVLGGLGAYCRSLYGELIPPGSEAAFYALYAITDKGSSIFGPTIVGAIIDKTGGIRPAFWFLAALVGLPAPLIYMIDVERGKKEGAKLAKQIVGADIEDREDGNAHEEEAHTLLANQEM
ncbi:autophagy-related protein 22-like protein [Emericellopsis atlantica]|uniref:Autophagy-related protein n=1 Tax=Emericellopsis atlantica TaxID=2614577 RepID=A0A9P7ZMX8_9HYPO|nr:autophagy-related protein 22-like protein [Emericellopsis atlantica]KAG9255079.1 autophagy-related protein 22-like protein [Emericellopsis atlantica]